MKVRLWRVFFGVVAGIGIPLLLLTAWFSWREWEAGAPRRRIKAIVVSAEKAEAYRLDFKGERSGEKPLTDGQLLQAKAALEIAFAYDPMKYLMRPRGPAPCYSAWDSGLRFQGAAGTATIGLDFACDNYEAHAAADEDHGMMGKARKELTALVTEVLSAK